MQVKELQIKMDKLTEKCSQLILEGKEHSQNKDVEHGYIDLINQVSKHLVTLVKFLREHMETTTDPTVIEKTHHQIKRVDKLHLDVRRVMKNSQFRTMGMPKFEAGNVSSDNNSTVKTTMTSSFGLNLNKSDESRSSSRKATPK